MGPLEDESAGMQERGRVGGREEGTPGRGVAGG